METRVLWACAGFMAGAFAPPRAISRDLAARGLRGTAPWGTLAEANYSLAPLLEALVSNILRSFTTSWRTLRADTESTPYNGFSPATDFNCWAGAVEAARITIETRNRVGGIEIVGAANFANTQFTPTDTAVNLGSTWINSETFTPAAAFTDLKAQADDFQIARFGFNTRLASAGSMGSVDARARIDVLMNPTLVRRVVPWTFLTTDSTTAAFFPATDWR